VETNQGPKLFPAGKGPGAALAPPAQAGVERLPLARPHSREGLAPELGGGLSAGWQRWPTLRYLANYVYRTAFGSERILKDGQITFRFRRSDNVRRETLTLKAEEFIRRFLQHVLPRGFQRVRYFGWMAPAAKVRWDRILALLDWKVRANSVSPICPPPICFKCNQPMILLGTIPRGPP
jgi:hypothetical protein